MRKHEMIGKKFGRLTVIQFAGLNNYKTPHRMWKCKCACGKVVVKSGPRLYAGLVKSCGCLNVEHMRRIPRESRMKNLRKAALLTIRPGAAMRMVLRDYKQNARKRGLEWKLTAEQFHKLAQSPCFYTGKGPSCVKTALSGEVYKYNGIDRLDNSKGYTADNCVPCCASVNRMKMNMTFSEFISLCEDVYQHLGSRKVELLA